ncbi:sigma-54 dependent transcriptional regulator [Chromobacterium amazonense]|uniref:sigma-54-dependent transcriptional regulator n=1 Tax=Chromobacterium amazonense TaxID=1382803 RepID=UPI00237DF0DA|nr:sigma-54 dependent transcriptional regulator [Chromobacterium amazonense]MDE1715654.1 sigma-54 dependent transcriptional regulator [Chromobacterium amazonense]
MLEPHILLVEDDPVVREACAQTLEQDGCIVRMAESAEAALTLFSNDPTAIVLSDIRLPGMDGVELLSHLRAMDPGLPVILVTGNADVEMAVQAMQDGAWDFIEKPLRRDRLLNTVKRALSQRRLQLENLKLRSQLGSGINSLLLGDSRAMRTFKAKLETIAGIDVDVLVLGETGSGKEVVARALHQAAGCVGNFVAINCAAVPESVFESEMFGVEPGAFTGATKRRIGKIEHTDGGTLFLDEIESMPLALQTKLLRVLETRCVERLGGNQQLPVSCRIVAASKVDLKVESEAGRFRADLYYRLNVVQLELPPLRERREDILQLFTHFAMRATSRYQKPLPVLDTNLSANLLIAKWPGNVRELAHAAERWVLGLEVFEEEVMKTASLSERLAGFEVDLIVEALRQHGGDVAAAALSLGIARKTLYDKLLRYSICAANFRDARASADGGTDGHAKADWPALG